MWTEVDSREAHDALVQDYLSRKKRLQTRFEAEKLGEADLQFEATKLFKSITAKADEQASKRTTEFEKVTKAIEQLPAAIAADADFNPVATLFGEEGA